MYILGISAFYHDSAACLLKNGNIISAAQEERFKRKKHNANFPHNSIKYCLHESQITGNDILRRTRYRQLPIAGKRTKSIPEEKL